MNKAVARLNVPLLPALGREAFFGFRGDAEELLLEVDVIPCEMTELLLAKPPCKAA